MCRIIRWPPVGARSAARSSTNPSECSASNLKNTEDRGCYGRMNSRVMTSTVSPSASRVKLLSSQRRRLPTHKTSQKRLSMCPLSLPRWPGVVTPRTRPDLTANCIIIAPKRLKLRLSGSARKSQKRFRDTPRFKFQAVLARTQPFLSRSVEKRGDQTRFKCRKMVNYYAIRSRASSRPRLTCHGCRAGICSRQHHGSER